MSEDEPFYNQWLQELAAQGFNKHKLIHIAIRLQTIKDDVRLLSDRLSTFLRNEETGVHVEH